MSTLKQRLRDDLTAAMKGRDELATATLRMALAAVKTDEVAGGVARELTDDQVVQVLTREVRRRREAAEAFAAGGRPDAAERERAEQQVLERYLPAQLSDTELADLTRVAVAEAGASTPAQLGAVMRLLVPRVAGRADGARVSVEVRRQLS